MRIRADHTQEELDAVTNNMVRDPVIKYLNNSVWFEDVEMNTTALIDQCKHQLRIRLINYSNPDSMVLLLKLFNTKDSKFNMNNKSTYEIFINLSEFLSNGKIVDIKEHPVIKSLITYGIEVFITTQAKIYLDNYLKRIQRFIIPFRFEVPEEFKDIDPRNNVNINGPFIDDVYRSEYKRNLKKLEDMGLLNQENDFFLHEFQANDAALLAIKNFAYIGHEQGLGKTAISIAVTLLAGYQRYLIVAPPASIGTFTSGWRHEIHRFGVPKENIHIINEIEDLPSKKREPKGKWPHYYLIDYNTLSKSKIEWAAFDCPICLDHIPAKNKGKCTGKLHDLSNAGQNISLYGTSHIPASKHQNFCPVCRAKELRKLLLSKNTVSQPRHANHYSHLRESWTGNYCDPQRGGCGFRLKQYVNTKAREKQGKTDPRPVYKGIKRGLFDGLLVDESQMIKNISSKRSKAVQFLKGFKRVYIITGTMMTNYLDDTFWQLQRLSSSGFFPINGNLIDFFAYKDHKSSVNHSNLGYLRFKDTFEGGVLNPNATMARRIHNIKYPKTFWHMLSCFMVRRLSTDSVVQECIQLPETKFHTEFIDMDPVHDIIYLKLVDKTFAEISKSVDDSLEVNQAELKSNLSQIRQICVCPDQDAGYTESRTTKDIRMLEIIKDKQANKEKCVVFTSYNDHLKRLAKLFNEEKISYLVVDGQTSRADKWSIIDQFRTKDDNWVLLATIQTLNSAVNLTPLVPDFDINTVIFGSPEWSPSIMDQAWKRVNRIGQTSDVDVYYLYHKNTIEEEMDAMLEAKRKVISFAMDKSDHERLGDVEEIDLAEIARRVAAKGAK